MWFALMIGTIWVSALVGMEKLKNSELIVYPVALTLFAVLGMIFMDNISEFFVPRAPGSINWFAVTIMAIWISTAVGTVFGNYEDGIIMAFVTTILMGIGYSATRELIAPRAAPSWFVVATLGLWSFAAVDSVRRREALWYGLIFAATCALGIAYLAFDSP